MQPHRRLPTRLPGPWDSPGKNTGVGCHFLLQCRKVKSESEVAQSCLTLSNPIDCSLPGSSVHGVFQTRVLEWGAIASSTEDAYLIPNLASLWHSLFPPLFRILLPSIRKMSLLSEKNTISLDFFFFFFFYHFPFTDYWSSCLANLSGTPRFQQGTHWSLDPTPLKAWNKREKKEWGRT